MRTQPRYTHGTATSKHTTHTPRYCIPHVPSVPRVIDTPDEPDEPNATSVSRPSRAHPTRPTSPTTHAVAYSNTHPLSHGLEESVVVDVGTGQESLLRRRSFPQLRALAPEVPVLPALVAAPAPVAAAP